MQYNAYIFITGKGFILGVYPIFVEVLLSFGYLKVTAYPQGDQYAGAGAYGAGASGYLASPEYVTMGLKGKYINCY